MKRAAPTLLLIAALLPASARADDTPLGFRIDVGGSFDHYGPNYTDPGFEHHRIGWEELGFVEVGYRVTPALTIIAGYTGEDPIQILDQQLNLGFYYGLPKDVTINGSVAYTPDRQIIALWDLQFGIDWQALRWLGVLANLRHLDFPSDQISGFPSGYDAVTIVGGGLRFSAIPRTTVTVQAGFAHHTGLYTNNSGTFEIADTGYSVLRIEYQLTDPIALTVQGSYGGESDRPFSPQTIQTLFGVGGGVRWQFSPAWAVRVDYLHEEFANEYIRNGVSSAFTVKF